MEEILNNLFQNQVLYTTYNGAGTPYRFIGRSVDNGIKYSINANRKTLPLNTIHSALLSFENGEIINARWYRNYNEQEYKNRPCNLKVLKSLLERL
jgi:hypothetical protein